MVHLPDYKIDPPETEEKAVCQCAECQNDLFEGDSAYKIGDKFYCDDCVECTTIEGYEPDWDCMPGGYDYY